MHTMVSISSLLCQRIEDEAIALGCSQDAFPCDLRKQIAMGTRLLKTRPEGFRAFLEFDAFSRRAGLQSTKCFFFETWCSIDFLGEERWRFFFTGRFVGNDAILHDMCSSHGYVDNI